MTGQYQSIMNPIYVPTKGPEDWRLLLAEPETQWKQGYSAKSLADCWEHARGFPNEIKRPLDEAFPGIRPLLIIPELKVSLPGGRRASQNDLWVLARTDKSRISITVEGKVEEPFGEQVSDWLEDASPGKLQRWEYLKKKLFLQQDPNGTIGYQLFHRTVSAILQAEEFGASEAVMIVHSFSKNSSWYPDYAAFLDLFSIKAEKGRVQHSAKSNTIRVSFLWAKGKIPAK